MHACMYVSSSLKLVDPNENGYVINMGAKHRGLKAKVYQGTFELTKFHVGLQWHCPQCMHRAYVECIELFGPRA